MDFKGFLNNVQGWDGSLRSSDKKSKSQAPESGNAKRGDRQSREAMLVEDKNNTSPLTEVSTKRHYDPYSYLRSSESISGIKRHLLNEESSPNANSEKDLGNEYFKQKKFNKAIECYSRSIALSPTSVAFANRAMSYLKVKRYAEAEIDCTEALNLDDRYVKAYSRRATARKELGKFKESLEDSEFALRLEPNNQEIRKLHTETKTLYQKEILKMTEPSSSPQGIQMLKESDRNAKGANQTSHLSKMGFHNVTPPESQEANERNHGERKHCLKPSVEELAARATTHLAAATVKNITTPKSAYEFEVFWRSLSDDPAKQADLLKSIAPTSLPQLFKNALCAPLLADIVKRITYFFKDEAELAVSILDNLRKVPRFDMIVMCLSPLDRSDLNRIWDEVFFGQHVPVEQHEALAKLRSKFCPR